MKHTHTLRSYGLHATKIIGAMLMIVALATHGVTDHFIISVLLLLYWRLWRG